MQLEHIWLNDTNHIDEQMGMIIRSLKGKQCLLEISICGDDANEDTCVQEQTCQE